MGKITETFEIVHRHVYADRLFWSMQAFVFGGLAAIEWDIGKPMWAIAFCVVAVLNVVMSIVAGD